MHHEFHTWRSPILDLDMPVDVWGHYGTPLLVFPTSGDDHRDYVSHSMLGALNHHLEGGRVKLFCIRSINQYSWLDDGLHPAEKARRQVLFDRYVRQEVVPFIHDHCHSAAPIGTIGSSFGTYHALNELLKHPDVFRWCFCMSGIYDMRRYTGDFYNDDVYFNNPPDYAVNLHDATIRSLLNNCSINIICGQGPWEHVEWSTDMAARLAASGIRHNLDLWGHDVSHDWPWWKKELDYYIGRMF